MKKKLTLLLLSITFAAISWATDNPIAHPDAIVLSGNMRFTVLTPQMIRIEYSEKQLFEDRASFTVINRRLPVPEYKTYTEGGFLYIKTDKLTLRYRVGSFPIAKNQANSSNLCISFNMNGKDVVWYPHKKDALNLKGTCRTLDSSNGDNKRNELEDGLISRSGWAVIDDSYATKRGDGSRCLMFDRMDDGMDWVSAQKDKDAFDWYFLGYGLDFKKALYDYTQVAGKIPMPPMYALGYWYSKYQKYNEQDFKDIVTDIETNDVPLDVMVVDTDWHINGWTGWSWNKDLFPNPSEFIGWLHKHNLKVTLNLHPAYGVETNEDNFAMFAKDMGEDGSKNIEWNLENKQFYKSLFKNIIRPHENIGVDFWWLDWQQWLTSKKIDGLSETFWCNYVFYNDMKAQKKGRTMIFHRWGGLGSHRYQIGFSGDCFANFPTLAFQPYFTATSANVGYGYWGHDLGGHVQPGDNDPELYLRWLQFGVFTPITRTHSTNSPNIERRIWKYPNFNLMKKAIELRYAMIPYIYSAARATYDTGISICRPLYYDNPQDAEAYKHENEYMFGDDILVNPIVEAAPTGSNFNSQTTWLPAGSWYDVAKNRLLAGNKSYTAKYDQSEIPYFFKAGSVFVNYPKMSNLKTRPDNLIIKFIPGGNGKTNLYEDEEDNDNYIDNACTFTEIAQRISGNSAIYSIGAAKGSFTGMLTERSYTAEILLSKKPAKVTVDGVDYKAATDGSFGSWNYNSSKKTTSIFIPKKSCAKEVFINVIY